MACGFIDMGHGLELGRVDLGKERVRLLDTDLNCKVSRGQDVKVWVGGLC